MVCLQQSFLHCTPHTFLPHNFFQVNNNGSSLKRVSFLVKSQHVSSEDRISKRQLLTLGVSIPGILLFAETPISFEGTGENVLAKHVAFFDRNNDGVVYPWETFQGFRAIGCGLMLSTVAGFIINVGLSHKTRPGKFPSLLFPIEIKNIAKAKHGSDSGVYDHQGRFVEAKFDAIFNKHAHSNANALTGKELEEMLKANREPKDYPGWFGAYIEWKILYNLCKDKNGFLERDVIRGVYDGSLFEKMELAKKESKKPKHG